jgi:hypothetical protein
MAKRARRQGCVLFDDGVAAKLSTSSGAGRESDAFFIQRPCMERPCVISPRMEATSSAPAGVCRRGTRQPSLNPLSAVTGAQPHSRIKSLTQPLSCACSPRHRRRMQVVKRRIAIEGARDGGAPRQKGALNPRRVLQNRGSIELSATLASYLPHPIRGSSASGTYVRLSRILTPILTGVSARPV